jgi:hypothetical protein
MQSVQYVAQNKQYHSNPHVMFILPAVKLACVPSQRTADRTVCNAVHRNTVTIVLQHDKQETRLNKRIIQRINTEVQYAQVEKHRAVQDGCAVTPVVHTFYKNLSAIRVARSHNSIVTCQPQGYLLCAHLCLTTRKLQQLHSKHVAPPTTAYVQP